MAGSVNDGTVAVVGLNAFVRDLKKLADPNTGALLKALTAAGKQAAQPVADVTRGRLPQTDRTDARVGELAATVRVTGTRTGAKVRMGSSSVRYAGWADFGGNRRVPHPSSRDYDSRGRYLFPAAVELQSTSARIYTQAVAAALNNFAWTNETLNPGDVHG